MTHDRPLQANTLPVTALWITTMGLFYWHCLFDKRLSNDIDQFVLYGYAFMQYIQGTSELTWINNNMNYCITKTRILKKYWQMQLQYK